MTNKELQLLLKQFPDDLPIGAFCLYESSQYFGAINEVKEVVEDYLGDINSPSKTKCLLLVTDAN